MRILRGSSLVFATAFVLSGGCDRGDNVESRATVIAADPARLEAARPHLASAARMAEEIATATRPCESPVPGYRGCERDHGQVLVLAPGEYGGAGSRVDALLWVPAGRRPQLTMTLWHFDSPGTALGHGWSQVTAISHVD